MRLLLLVLIALFLLQGCATDSNLASRERDKDVLAMEAVPSQTEPITLSAMRERDRQPLAESARDRESLPMSISERDVSKSFEAIFFDYDSSLLKDPARAELQNVAEFMLKKQTLNITLEGHCDERGSAEYNLVLGENRAKAAQRYLITLGVQMERLSTISYGKERPFVAGHEENAWALNRRVEFVRSSSERQ